MKLRKYISMLLSEEVHAFHGYKFGPDRMGLRGPQFSDEDKVTDEDVESALDWLDFEDPDELVAFSRGAAVLDQMVFDEPETIDELPPVTYVSPAALRKWTSAPIPKLPMGSNVVHSDGDNIVPLKHACAVADKSGAKLGVAKGKGDGKDHVRALGKRNNPDYILDPKKCLSSELPDWGSDGSSTEEELKAQIKIARELGLKEESLRVFVRSVLSESVDVGIIEKVQDAVEQRLEIPIREMFLSKDNTVLVHLLLDLSEHANNIMDLIHERWESSIESKRLKESGYEIRIGVYGDQIPDTYSCLTKSVL